MFSRPSLSLIATGAVLALLAGCCQQGDPCTPAALDEIYAEQMEATAAPLKVMHARMKQLNIPPEDWGTARDYVTRECLRSRRTNDVEVPKSLHHLGRSRLCRELRPSVTAFEEARRRSQDKIDACLPHDAAVAGE